MTYLRRTLPLLALWVSTICAQPPAFEVASVKVTAGITGEGGGRPQVTVSPGSLILRNHTLRDLIEWAYKVQSHQVSGGEKLDSPRYEISARAGRSASVGEMRLMLQALLAERFKLDLHREKKDMQVYELSVARGGPKMRIAAAGEQSGVKRVLPGFKHTFTAQSPSQLADFLSGLIAVNRPVVDKTGLDMLYSFTLDLTEAAPPSRGSSQEDAGTPSVSSVLQEQLGLKLQGARGPIEILVIDRVQSPSTN